MEGKKVSFGFMKTKKADKPLAHINDERKDYIECVEEQSIKIVGGEDVPVNEPLVIPLKPNTLMKSDRLKEIAIKVESALEEPSIKQEVTDVTMADPLAENLTLDQMAERELLREAKKDVVVENPTISIPTSSKGVAEGEIESTLDDYEAVPVQEFGVAMLRGMGWKPGQSGSTYKQPELRPKGLGLGAHKVVKAKPKVTKDGKQEELAILKNSFVKITCGKYADFYGKVVSLDEENGRVMVDIPLKKETVSLSEFMMHVVTKSEYDRESKVIRKHKLCVDEKRQIIAMHEKKMPVSDIARRLNIARNTVYLWITRWEKEGVLKAHLPSGRPRKLTPHKEASLFEDIAHKTNLNMSDLAENHGVSIATIRRHIKDKGIQDKNEKQMDEDETDSIVTNIIDIEVKIDADIGNEEESKRMTLEYKRKRIIELHQQKYTVAAIAKRLNIARQAVVLCVKCWKLQKAGNACVTVKPVEKNNNAQKKIQRASSQPDSDTDHTEFTTPYSRKRENSKRRRGKIPAIEFKTDIKLHKKRTINETKEDVSQSGNRQLNEMQKENIIAMYKLKQPISVIARRLKITRKTANMWIKRWKSEGALKRQTSSGRPPKLSANDEATLIEEVSKQAEDLNLSDLASNHGVSITTVRRCLKQHGINFKQMRQGVMKSRAKEIICSDNEFEEIEERSRTKKDHLSLDRKIKILTLYEQKHSISAIARHLNVARQAVVLCIKCWKLQKAGNACVTVKPVEKNNNAKKKIQRASSQQDSDTDHKEFTTPSSRTLEYNKRRRGKIPAIEIKSDIKFHEKRTAKEIKEDASQSGNRQLNETQKENIIAMYKLKHPISVIARRLKITRKTANMWIKRWKSEGALKRQTSSGRPPKLSANDEATLIEEVSKQAEDLNLSDLASNHGVSITTVRRCLKQHGINFKQMRQGVMKSRAKEIICSDNEFEEIEERSRTKKDHLSLDRKIKILTLYEQKHSISAIARHLNVARQAVVLCIKCWKLQKAGNACVTVKPVEKNKNAKKKIQRASSQPDSDTDHKEFTTPSSRTLEYNKRRRGKIPAIEIKSDIKFHKKRTAKEIKEDASQSGNRQLNETQKENIIAMYKLKQPISVIARRLKITRKTANMWIKRWKSEGVLKRQTSSGRPPKLSANDEATLIEEVSKQAEDLNLSDLASNHGVSITTVRRCLKQHGINIKQMRQGVMKSRAKEIICSDNEFEEIEERSRTKKDHLSLDRKIKILTLYEQKHSISAIARHLNVAKNTVRLWVRRWQGEGTIEAHVPSGRPRKLTVDAEALLKAQVLEGGPLQMNKLASSHGVSTTTIRRRLRANGLNTTLQKGNQDCSNLQNSFQDFYCNSILTELDCQYDTSHDKDQNLDNITVVTKMVCDRGTSLDPPTPTAPAELESNTVSDGFQDSCSGNVVTKIVCDRGTSPNEYENE